MIPEDYLTLTLGDVLALHDTRRTCNGASIAQLEAALRALEARLAKQERGRCAKTCALLESL